MRLCIPTDGGTGPDAMVHGHFGSAPCFVLHDTETGETMSLENRGKDHEHGVCNPLGSLAGESVDAIVVGGIGARALMGLNGAGIRVFRAIEGTVAENAAAAKGGVLVELTVDASCGHHGQGCGCS